MLWSSAEAEILENRLKVKTYILLRNFLERPNVDFPSRLVVVASAEPALDGNCPQDKVTVRKFFLKGGE